MFKKEIKYGYSTETIGDNTAQIVKPLNLTKIRLTPTNSKFMFYGTRHDILKWMSSHSELLVEYDPLDQSNNNNNNNDGLAFSPPPSPPPSARPVISEILATSPTSLNFPSISTVDPTSQNQHDITFDLFPAPIKTSALLSDDLVFYRPLNLALNYIPWVEVMLEVRPTDQYNDLKLSPIHRVILPSGSSLSKVSKALEKSWKNLIPDLTGHGSRCFIRDDISSHSKKKSKSNSPVLTPTNSDNEGGESEEGEQSYNKETHQQKFIDWFPKARQKQSDDIIPPGILTPYIIDDVLKDLGEKREESVKEQVLSDKREEAESNKESPKADLPRYENTYKDVLLEEGI